MYGKINLGFLVVEGKTIPWCGRKSIPYLRSNVFLVQERINSLLKR